MTELDLPIYAIDPLYRVDMRCDGMVRWDYRRMMERTATYCKHVDYYDEILETRIEGWWMSRQSLDNFMIYEWPQ
ncbi:MAG: hypothetical protein JW908_04435 [Anaerolineales bacterium]|nr:hypothetical protein [Anaerolineales bacterium]